MNLFKEYLRGKFVRRDNDNIISYLSRMGLLGGFAEIHQMFVDNTQNSITDKKNNEIGTAILIAGLGIAAVAAMTWLPAHDPANPGPEGRKKG
jgi:hypothetical protein